MSQPTHPSLVLQASPDHTLIPGLDMVGRGVFLKPQQPFELRGLLFRRDSWQTYPSKETGAIYRIPECYEINDSPPMPASQALNQVRVEESWERFEKSSSLDVSAAVGNGPVSVDVNASQNSQLRSEEDSYYAVRNSFIPLWSIYIPDDKGFVHNDFDLDIPVPYDPKHRRAYARFFERFGTHYIRRVWVGGKATLIFTVAKSSSISIDDIKAGIKASLAGTGSASVNASSKTAKERLANNSECTVFGKGGDELMLATLSSLDESRYNQWLSTIKDNPQVIEFDAVGNWTLVKDEQQSDTLRQAYIAETVFTPIRVVFSLDNRVHIFRGKNCFSYRQDIGETTAERPIAEKWPMLAQVGFSHVDAAFLGKYLVSQSGESLDRKLYFFNRDQYIRVDVDAMKIDPGYPRLITEGWPGVPFNRIDAALNVSADSIYFFLGNQYVRFNMLSNSVDEGYPQPTNARWVGLGFDRIDAAVYWGNAKVFFFRGNQHVRYDLVTYRSDPGFPKYIFGNYVEDWKFLD